MTNQTKRYQKGDGFDAWWEDRNIPQKVLVVIGFIILGAGFLAVCGLVVMLLWNWLMPEIFGLTTINYWQAWGLLILSSILFKGMKFSDDSKRTERKRKKHLRKFISQEDSSETEKPAEPEEA